MLQTLSTLLRLRQGIWEAKHNCTSSNVRRFTCCNVLGRKNKPCYGGSKSFRNRESWSCKGFPDCSDPTLLSFASFQSQPISHPPYYSSALSLIESVTVAIQPLLSPPALWSGQAACLRPFGPTRRTWMTLVSSTPHPSTPLLDRVIHCPTYHGGSRRCQVISPVA